MSFIVLEPADQMSHERLQQWVGSSLPQLTRFRSRLVDRPWGLGPPFWTEIDRYDPSSQIHRATLQAPGGQREFADLIAHLSAGSRHQREMLWEAWSIDGLSGGRWALALRLSPVLSERGVGAAAIWSRLLRSDPHHAGSDDQPRQPSPGKPAVGELVAEVISELLEFQFKGVYLVAETVSGLLHVVRRQLGGMNLVDERDSVPPAVSSMRGPVPRNAFSAPLTDRRAVAFASICQADLEAVSTAFGGDVTNVLLAACTLSLRAWLQRYDTVPDDPLAMWMPLAQSGAAPGEDRELPIAAQIRIPVQLGDPIEILTNLHTATEQMNTAHSHDDEKEHFTGNTAAITSLIPSTVLHAGMRIVKTTGCAATTDADLTRQCLSRFGSVVARVLRRRQGHRYVYRDAAAGRLRVDHHANDPRRADASHCVRVSGQCARGRRDSDRNCRRARHPGGSRTQIPSRTRSFGRHRDDSAHQQAPARARLLTALRVNRAVVRRLSMRCSGSAADIMMSCACSGSVRVGTTRRASLVRLMPTTWMVLPGCW